MMRVLVVEDEEALREALADYLPEHGIEPLLARTGEEGLRRAQEEMPDAIVLDVRLPGVDGFEACRRMKRQDVTKDLPVVFLTARAEQKDKLQGFEAGGVDYLTKPFQLEELVMRLRYHVDRARMDRQLREANTQLRLEAERLDRVLSITAHDLGGPLEGLSLVLEMLRAHPEQRSQESFETLLSTVRSLRKLVDELLVWARTGAIGLEPVRRPVQIWAVARRNLEVVRTMAENKGVRLEAKVSANVWAHTDRNMLDTVVRNLVINAVKFTEEGGTVSVKAHRRSDRVVVSVSDDGLGIPQERLEGIFEPENRVSTLGTRGEAGSGLGLALASRLVRSLGGIIEVDSALGRGSTFTVSLPDPGKGPESDRARLASGRR